METKLFEVRDRITFIPVICIKIDPANEAERYLISSAGYGVSPEQQRRFGVLMARLRELNFVDHPFSHPGHPTVRTMPVAHRYIIDHWGELETGAVIDVEFISGETAEPKTSQRTADLGKC